MTVHTVRAASQKQRDFVRSLLGDIEPSAGAAERRFAEIAADGTFDSVRATSRLIDSLMADARAARAARREAPKAAGMPEVPAARYAVYAADGGWDFYRVDRPAKGKWAGYTFVKRLFGAPGNFRSERLSRAQSATVLEAILGAEYADGDRVLSGPEAAAVAFSREHGVCAACLSPLTDAASIAAGLGPVCRARF